MDFKLILAICLSVVSTFVSAYIEIELAGGYDKLIQSLSCDELSEEKKQTCQNTKSYIKTILLILPPGIGAGVYGATRKALG